MKSQKAQTVIRTAVIVVISLIIGISVYTWNAKNISGDAMPMPFGMGVGVVLSGSMEPDISIDDVIIVKKIEPQEYRKGDVVVYQSNRMLVVHEIIEISEDGKYVTTKGKANNDADSPISVGYIKGKVVKIYPELGKIVNLIKTPIVTVIILAVAIMLLVLSYRKGNDNDEDSNDDKLEMIRAEIERLKAEQGKK